MELGCFLAGFWSGIKSTYEILGNFTRVPWTDYIGFVFLVVAYCYEAIDCLGWSFD
jgi:hypothetical protein